MSVAPVLLAAVGMCVTACHQDFPAAAAAGAWERSGGAARVDGGGLWDKISRLSLVCPVEKAGQKNEEPHSADIKCPTPNIRELEKEEMQRFTDWKDVEECGAPYWWYRLIPSEWGPED